MKKIFIYSLLCLCAYQLKAQESVLFKIKYTPGKSYDSNVTINLDCNVNLSGDTTILSKLKSQGMTLPIDLKVGIGMSGNIKTGQPGPDSVYPVKIGFGLDNMNMTVNGKEIPVPADKMKATTFIYGHIGADGKLRADSISGGLKDTSEKHISQLMNAIQNKINFPDHEMKVGESFTQDMPFNVPVAGSKMDINAKTTYKLIKIADGNAYFDVLYNMDMSIPVAGETITLAGTGTGKMVYSIKDNFATDMMANITLKVNGKIKTLAIDATAAMNLEYKYVIN